MDSPLYNPIFDLPLAAAIVIVASIIGGLFPAIARLTHRQMQHLLSLVAGLMLGVGAFDLTPEAIENFAGHGGSIHSAVISAATFAVAGFLAMFLLERFLCYHHHDTQEENGGCDHGHAVTWRGAIIGLTIHSLVGGIALAAAIESGVAAQEAIPGLAAVLAITLHKPFDALTLGTLMAAAKESKGRRHAVNILFSLATPIGMGGAAWFFQGDAGGDWMAAALAFSAGTFFCIALSDLLPELHFHQHDRIGLTVALLIGLGIAWGVASSHDHSHDHAHGETPPAAISSDEHVTDDHGDHVH